jgi:hypothetical protein
MWVWDYEARKHKMFLVGKQGLNDLAFALNAAGSAHLAFSVKNEWHDRFPRRKFFALDKFIHEDDEKIVQCALEQSGLTLVEALARRGLPVFTATQGFTPPAPFQWLTNHEVSQLPAVLEKVNKERAEQNEKYRPGLKPGNLTFVQQMGRGLRTEQTSTDAVLTALYDASKEPSSPERATRIASLMQQYTQATGNTQLPGFLR